MKRMDPCAFLLSTDGVSGRSSGMVVTWMSRCDKNSWMVSVNQASNTLRLIRSSREFVLSFASKELVDEVSYFGSTTGADSSIDKLSDTRIVTRSFTDTRIRTPLLSQAYRNIACKVRGIQPVSDEYAIVYGTIVEQCDNPAAEQLYYCGKDEAGGRRFSTQRAQDDTHIEIAEILPCAFTGAFVKAVV